MEETRENSQLLTLLHRGELSRNSDFELLSTRRGRRVHRLFKRLRALLGEVSRPDASWCLESRPDGENGVMVKIEKMGYTRCTVLSGWEAEFFLDEMGASKHLGAAAREIEARG